MYGVSAHRRVERGYRNTEGIQEHLAYIVQGFGSQIAVPHLHSFTAKHDVAGKPSVIIYST